MDFDDPPPPMRIAIKESNKSKHKQKLGATIARGNKVLARACNVLKTDPVYGSGEHCYLHAEGHVIKKAIRSGINIVGTTIFVYRSRNRLAKPCSSCMKLIERHGIKRIHFSGSL